MYYECILNAGGTAFALLIVSTTNLLLGLLLVSSGDLVVLELVRVLRRGDDPEVIPELLLLEVALREVLQLALGETEVLGAGDGDLGAVAGDDDVGLGEVAGLALDLDALVEVLLEGSNVKDLIVDGGRTVNDELDGGLLGGLGLGLFSRG